MKKAPQIPAHLAHLIMATTRANQEGIDWLQLSMTDLMFLMDTIQDLQAEVEMLLKTHPPKLDHYI